MEQLAVVILNYNSADDCRQCVEDIRSQKGVDTDIILVDNASDPDDINRLLALASDFDLTLIEAAENRGYNAGNNLGLRLAAERGYSFAFITNPDMRFPDSNYLWRLADEFKRFPNAAIAGSDIINENNIHSNPLDPANRWTYSLNWTGDMCRHIFHLPNPKSTLKFHSTVETDILLGSALLIRIDFLKEIGFFDENNFLYCEEWILERKMRKLGKRALFVPSLQAIHHRHPDKSLSNLMRLKHQLNSRIYWINNYSGYSRLGRFLAIGSFRINYLILFLRFKFFH